MQAKPQRLVGNHVVIGPVVVGLDHDCPHPEPLALEQTASGRLSIVGAHAVGGGKTYWYASKTAQPGERDADTKSDLLARSLSTMSMYRGWRGCGW